MDEMNCEDFEAIGLDAERDASLSEVERVAAREHASRCPRCAALQDSWQAARMELHAFAEQTILAQTPARVEMRLRQDFRTQHGTLKVRRTAVVAAWALAAAAVLAAAISWTNWRKNGESESERHGIAARVALLRNSTTAPGNGSRAENGATDNLYASIPSEDGADDFTLLPGALGSDTDESAILRVRMQRGTLVTLGFPVNEERAAEWIQVDFLVGDDGLPQAVRLAR
jgi:anti-sigma factor RsiW